MTTRLHSALIKKGREIVVSFSGGRTSAFMAQVIKNYCTINEQKVHFIFANTGLEHEGTLEFVEACDKQMGLNLIWVEALVNATYGKGIRHTLVNFNTATRGVGVFAGMASKYSLPSQAAPHCTKYLKAYPINSYLRSIGLTANKVLLCIGIRADEFDRMNSNADKLGIAYPLIALNITKSDVMNFWAAQTYDLQIPEHQGNCITCWKKSDRKLYAIYKENPAAFEPFKHLDMNYAHRVIKTRKEGDKAVHAKMFRMGRTTADIISLAEAHIAGAAKNLALDIDHTIGCEESCEVYAEDMLKGEETDPTPHCTWCGAKEAKHCKCPERAEND